MFRKIMAWFGWFLDWYDRADRVTRFIVQTGAGGSMLTGLGTFLTSVREGLSPLLSIFFSLLGVILVGVIVLIVLEIRGNWPRNKPKKGTAIPPDHPVPSHAVQVDGKSVRTEWDIETESHGAMAVGERGTVEDSKVKVRTGEPK
jgi:hypothetical protein